MFAQQFCHRLFLNCFAQSQEGCALTIPPNTVPNSVFISIHYVERGDRALVPVLNLAQDGINILRHGKLAQGGIGDRYHVWRNPVGEIGSNNSLRDCVGLKGDFVPHIRGTKRPIGARREGRECLSVDAT